MLPLQMKYVGGLAEGAGFGVKSVGPFGAKRAIIGEANSALKAAAAHHRGSAASALERGRAQARWNARGYALGAWPWLSSVERRWEWIIGLSISLRLGSFG